MRNTHKIHANREKIKQAVLKGEKTEWITAEFNCSHMTVVRLKRSLGVTQPKYVNKRYQHNVSNIISK